MEGLVWSQLLPNDNQSFFDRHIGKQADHVVGIHDLALLYLYSLNVLTEGGCIFYKIFSFSYQGLLEIWQRSRQVVSH